MRTFLLVTLLIGCTGAQALAEQRGPDHRWTVEVAGKYFGIVGFDALPSSPQHTHLLFGPVQWEFPLSFPVTVACVLLALLFILVPLTYVITRRRQENAA